MKKENGSSENIESKENKDPKEFKLIQINRKNPESKPTAPLKNLFKNDFILNTSVSSTKNTSSIRQKSNTKDYTAINRSLMNSKTKLDTSKNLNDSSLVKNKPSYIKIKSISKNNTLKVAVNKNFHKQHYNNKLNETSNVDMSGERLYRRGIALISQKIQKYNT